MLSLVKVALAFAGVLFLLRQRVHMAWTMLAAALALAVLFSVPVEQAVPLAVGSLTSRATLELASSIALIMFLEGILRESGLMKEMVGALLGLARDSRVVVALLPVLIGFLPSPAWARFMAPVVEEMTEGTTATPVRKAFITYWFQHVSAYVSPLFPALILAASLLAMPLSSLILALLPASLLALALGVPFAFAGIPSRAVLVKQAAGRLASAASLARALAPVVAVVGLVLANVNVVLALGAVALACAAVFRYGARRLVTIARQTVALPQVATMFAVMLFKDVLVATGALGELPVVLAALQIPPLAVILVFSLLAGVLTGSSQSSIIMALPMLAGLPGGTNSGLFALVFVWGFSGLMLAPAHPCFILTVQHFRTSFATVQRLVLLPQTVLVAVITAVYLLLPGGGT
ncbi:MAG: DUF401 family protein [Chloroflexota bacterium]